jgi:hypothetical protein
VAGAAALAGWILLKTKKATKHAGIIRESLDGTKSMG